MNKTIAVLLTVHNRKDKTLKCLEKLYEQNISNEYIIDVYLTNDGCTDGTHEAINTQYPQVNIILGNGKLFWNRGMRIAWEAAVYNKEYEFYLWLNDDTIAYPEMIKLLLNASTKQKDKAIIVGATVDTQTHKKHTYGGRIDNKLVPLTGKIEKIDSFNGNIVLIPLSVFNILGFNDNYFTHSFGDLDYGLRAKKMGIECYQVGIPVGECDRHENLMTWCSPNVPLKKRWKALTLPTGYRANEVWYFNKKHYGIMQAMLHVVTTYTRCLFPNLWIKMNKADWR